MKVIEKQDIAPINMEPGDSFELTTDVSDGRKTLLKRA